MLSVQLHDDWFITNGIVQIIVETRVYGIVFLCNLEWRLTATIIVKYCWRRSCCDCCHASRKYPVTISYSNRTVHLRTGRMTQSHRQMPDFISPDQWPPNNPDMNPVDYKIWAVMQQRVYEKRVNDVNELCQRLLIVWHSIGQNVIDKAIDQWRARVTACVRLKGGHFEHLM